MTPRSQQLASLLLCAIALACGGPALEVGVASDAGASEPDAAAPARDAAIAGADAMTVAPPDAGPAGPRLDAVEPSSGGASAVTTVLLRGSGFGPVARVEVGAALATGVELVDSSTVRAAFSPVPLVERGEKPVRVVFAAGGTVELSPGFEYLFDEDPVVFVHGHGGTSHDFDAFVARFVAEGYPADRLFAIDYPETSGSRANAQQLGAFVADALQRTGAARVDVVAHSMGGLSTRLFVKNGGAASVRDYVSLAGAHHGTLWASFLTDDGAREMSPAYACGADSFHAVQSELNGCLTDAGRTEAADETPFGVEDGGTVAWLSISSEQDQTIVPSESSCLNQQRKNDCSDPVNVRVRWLLHTGLLTDSAVQDRVVEHLRTRNPSHP